MLLLDGIDYYQVIFTLPDVLSKLALANRSNLADLLFQSAWKALKKTIRSEQDYDPAALMVLHSWNQKLEAHWHVHALVPGGGPSLQEGSWKTSQAPISAKADMAGDSKKYLVDAINLRTSFRKFAIAKLQRLRRDGKLKFGGSLEHLCEDDSWEELIDELRRVKWVNHIEPPRNDESRPEHVVRYLTRYLTGGPISDHRITAADANSVTFLAREGKTVGGEDIQVPHTLPTEEFVRRWCLHIQSGQLTKTRYFGGWSNGFKDGYLERCAIAMEAADVPTANDIEFDPESIDSTGAAIENEPLVCEHCGSEWLTLVDEVDKPSWQVVFDRDSDRCPSWYAQSLRDDHRRFWTRAKGAEFYDWYAWYLKSGGESARDDVEVSVMTPTTQLTLPGIDATGIHQSDPF